MDYRIDYRIEVKKKIKKGHPFYNKIDELCCKSAKLYNYVMSCMAAHYEKNGEVIPYKILYDSVKVTEPYKELPPALAAQLLRETEREFLRRKGVPRYLLEDSRYEIIFPDGACRIVDGSIRLHKVLGGLILPTQLEDVRQVHIYPQDGSYVVKCIGTKKIALEPKPELKYTAGIDLGIRNFATVAVYAEGVHPLIINGNGLKSYNVWYNQKIVGLKGKKLNRAKRKRSNYMNDFFHKASREIVNYLIESRVKYLVIGDINIARRRGAKEKIPFSRFINMLVYKAQEAGMDVYIVNERYTSSTSFIDNEPPEKEFSNKARRISRGLFKTGARLVNADVNSAYQIIKKVAPNAQYSLPGYGVVGCGLQPVRLNIS